MAMKVVNVKTEKVLDTDPNIYLKRAEENLKNGQYNEALEEANLAVKYSNNNQRVKEQYNRIKSTVEEYNAKLNPGKFIKIAEQHLQGGRYDEAIEQAQMAVKYSNNDEKYVNEFKIIKSIVDVKQSELRRLEKEADSHMENARTMIGMEKYDEALQEARAGLACVNSSKYINEFNSIEAFIKRRKAEIKADKAMENAKSLLSIGEYDKALTEAGNAIQHSSDSKYVNEFNKIKTVVENKKVEIEADKVITEAKSLIKNGEYYSALETANYARVISKNHECHRKYTKEFNNIESSLKELPKDQLHIIADAYNRNNILDEAREWYKCANDAKAYYELGKIDIYKSYNEDSGISYVKRAADRSYVPALIELIHIYTQGRRFGSKDFKAANKYYEVLRKVDKTAAKEVLGTIKKKYHLSLVEILKINGWLKRIIIISTVIVLLSGIYIETMFSSGKWKAKINNASIEISSNVIGLGENEAYQVKLNMIPFFAKEPMKEVVSEDSTIAKIEDGKIQGINEGKTNIVLYLDEKEVKKVPITVSKIGVKDFKISYNGELNLLGDSISPNIEIIYFNDIKRGEANIKFSSSNEDVVRVIKNKLVAIGEGKATVTVKVDDLEKKLVFNIKKKDISKNSSAESNSNNSSVESNSNKNDTELTYKTYTNRRYGFSIDYPTNLIKSTQIANGDGSVFENNSGTVSIIASGRNNVLNETAESLYNKDLSKLKVQPDYKSLMNNSYAISWKEYGLINYEYYTVGGNNGSIQGFIIKYPDNQKDIYGPMVTRVYKSFKANELDKAH